MKKLFIIIAFLGFVNIATAAGQSSDAEKQQLQVTAKQIVDNLKLNSSNEKLVYNALYHVKTRIEDLALGTPNYDKLLGYIDEERTEMMKVIMPTGIYKEYIRIYNPIEETKIQKLKEINNEYVSSANNKDFEANAIMKRDRLLSESL